MDRTRARPEESQDPLPLTARGGPVNERMTDGLDAKEVLLSGGHWTAQEREAQMKGLPREAERQTMTDRVGPR